jgi:hypothetical protein
MTIRNTVELTDLWSALTGWPVKETRHRVRVLRTDGLLPDARVEHAPLSDQHLTTFVIGALASETHLGAADAVRRYSSLRHLAGRDPDELLKTILWASMVDEGHIGALRVLGRLPVAEYDEELDAGFSAPIAPVPPFGQMTLAEALVAMIQQEREGGPFYATQVRMSTTTPEVSISMVPRQSQSRGHAVLEYGNRTALAEEPNFQTKTERILDGRAFAILATGRMPGTPALSTN